MERTCAPRISTDPIVLSIFDAPSGNLYCMVYTWRLCICRAKAAMRQILSQQSAHEPARALLTVRYATTVSSVSRHVGNRVSKNGGIDVARDWAARKNLCLNLVVTIHTSVL